MKASRGQIRIVKTKISRAALGEMARAFHGDLVKAVVDIEKRIVALGGGLHSDEEAALLGRGSRQENLWGINLYPDKDKNDSGWIEFDSMINLRPSQDNRSRGVDDPAIRQKIVETIDALVE